MWKNYFIIAFRSFKKQKLITFINICGLAVGIAGFMLTWLFVLDEVSYDDEWVFIATAILMLFIAQPTVIFKTVKAANLNPVKALRYE